MVEKANSSFIMNLVLMLILGASLLPVALSQFFSTDTSSWDTAVVNIWNVVPIIGIAVFLYGIYNRYM